MTVNIAVIGAGRMGADHVRRLHQDIRGAAVAAVVDVDFGRAHQAAAPAGAPALESLSEALALDHLDAVLIATPGFLHEQALAQVLERGLPVLCEKPLTPDAASAWRVIQAEREQAEKNQGRRLIQVGFMRRFDAGYRQLKREIDSGSLGCLLMLHCVHRNPGTPSGFTEQMLIHDSVVHEFDVIRFLTGQEISTVQVRRGRGSSFAPGGISDPQQVLIETEGGVLVDVEIFVNAQYGYEASTQAVFENGVRSIGVGEVTPGFAERFGAAYDAELQAWVDAVAKAADGGHPVAGPTAWDGYATAACCEAGVAAQIPRRSHEAVPVVLADKPELYR